MLKFIGIILVISSGLVLAITPNLLPMGLHTDKALHLIIFATLSACIAHQYLFNIKKLLYALSALALIGLTIEAIQMLTPNRATQIEDVASNIAGIILGSSIAYLLKTGYYGESYTSLKKKNTIKQNERK